MERHALLFIVLSSFAAASDYTWTADTNSNWSTATNWDPSGPPGAADTAIFPSGTFTPALDTDSSISALECEGTTTLSGSSTLTLAQSITSSGMLSCSVPIIFPNATTITIDPAHSISLSGDLSGAGVLNLTSSDGTGTLTLSGTNTFGGASITSGILAISSASSLGLGTIQLLGGSLHVDDTIAPTNMFTTGAASSAISVASGKSCTLSNPIDNDSSPGGLTLNGGTLTLGATCGYTLGTTISSGTLALGSSGSISNSSGVNIASGATLSTTSSLSIKTLSGAGTLDTAGAITVTQNSAGSFTGPISGGTSLTLGGTARLDLKPASATYAGPITITGGELAIQDSTALGSSSAIHLTGGGVIASATYTLTNSITTLDTSSASSSIGADSGVTFTIPQSIGGTGGLHINGNGTVEFISADGNAFSGGLWIDSGTLKVADDNLLGEMGTLLTLNGGTISLPEGFMLADTRPLATTNNSSGISGPENGMIYVIRSISGTGGIVFSAMTVALEAPTAYTGPTLVSSGDLLFVGMDQVSISSSSSVTIASGASITTGNSTVGLQTLSGGGTLTGSFGQSATLMIQQNSNTEFSGVIDGHFSTLTKTGSAQLILSGENTYTQGTTISEGTLAVIADTGLGATHTPLLIAGGTLSALTGFTLDANRIVTTSSISSGIFVRNTQQFTISQMIADGETPGGLTITSDGTGVLVLGDSNTYSLGTAINSGILQVTTDAALGATTGPLKLNGGTLRAADTFTLASTRTVTTSSASSTLDVTSGKVLTIPQVISDGTPSGGISISCSDSSSGSVLFKSMCTYTGPTHILSGADLQLWDSGSISTAISTAVDGTLDFTHSALSMTSVNTLSGSGTVTGSGQDFNVIQNGDATFSGTIAGSPNFIKQGTSTLTFSGTNSSSNSTQIQTGTLSVNSDACLGATSPAASLLFAGGTLAVTETFTLTPARMTTVSAASGIYVSNPKQFIINQEIIGNGGFTLNSDAQGALILGGTNSFTGGMTIHSGILQIGADRALGASNGALALSGGTLQVTESFTLSSTRAITTSNPSIIDVNTGKTFIIPQAITGTGGIQAGNTGTGILELQGSCTYSGATAVKSGTLALTQDGALPNTSAVTILTGATLDAHGISASTFQLNNLSGQGTLTLAGKTLLLELSSPSSFDGVISGAEGGISLSGNQTFTLSQECTYTGATTIQGGTLHLSGNGSIAASTSLAIASGATFDSSAVSDLNIAVGSLSGMGTLTTSGSQNLTINQTQAGTFSGTISGLTTTLTKMGPESLNLTGTIPTLEGTFVDEGQLALNTSLSSPLIVALGAILKGTGPVIGDVTVEGTLQPGNSIGTFSITGNLLLGPQSVTTIEISPNANSLIAISGTASLDGTLSVIVNPGLYTDIKQYTILTAGMIQEGTTFFQLSGPPGSTLFAEYTGNSVLLFYSGLLIDYSASGNAARLLDYLNAHEHDPLLASTVTSLSVLSEAQLTAALISMTPDRNTTATFASQNMMFSLSKSITHHLAGQRMLQAMYEKRGSSHELALNEEISSSFMRKQKSFPCTCPDPTPEPKSSYSFWMDGFVEFSHQKAQSQIPAFRNRSGGFLMGFDAYLYDRGVVGCAIGYARSALTQKQDAGSNHVDLVAGSLYGTYYLGQAYFETAIWGSYNHFHTERHIVYPGFDAVAKGSFDGVQVTPHFGMGYDFLFPQGIIEPFVLCDWVFNAENGYQEHGAGAINMRVKNHYSSMLRFETGLSGYKTHETSYATFVARAVCSYVYKHPYSVGAMTAGIVGIPGSFLNDSFTKAQSLVAPTLGLFCKLKKSEIYVSLTYQGEFGSGYRTNEALAEVGKYF